MRLHDHFHPPLSERRPWESFHTTWASALADHLNQAVLPAGYIALEQVHAGAPAEIDVSAWSEADGGAGGTAVATRTVWTPAVSPLVLPASFPPGCTVEIQATDGGRTLAAAVELLSPANKDRASKRRLFAAKCATYLARGVGLVIVDVVTSRLGNLHNDLVDLLQLDAALHLAAGALYVVAYRPLSEPSGARIDAWPTALAVGQELPIVPLSLGADLCLSVDLGVAYADACRRRRILEVVE